MSCAEGGDGARRLTTGPERDAPDANRDDRETAGTHASEASREIAGATVKPGTGRFRLVEVIPALVVLAALLSWVVPAMKDHTPDDLRLAYEAGEEAWRSGHPETVKTWMSTAFLGLVMAITTRVLPLTPAVIVLNVTNLLLLLATIAGVWWWLRTRTSRIWWWSTLALAVSYSPVVSTFRWKQFNLVALALALLGFYMIRRGREWTGAILAALSIALKPIIILLPIALFLRRDTRRAALLCVSGVIVFSMAGQAFLALRAKDVRVLWPVPTLETFSERARVWGSNAENFAPMGTVRRLNRANRPMEKGFVALAVLCLALLANESVRTRPGKSWEMFAWACALSPMVGPVGWSHYQLLLGPLFMVLVYQMALRRAAFSWWMPLAFAYILTSLVQRPLSTTLPGALVTLLTGEPEEWKDVLRALGLGQFAQYFLVATALAWFNRTRDGDRATG